MPFPGFPVREDIDGNTPVQGVHGAHHAALAVAVNALQVALDALGPGLNGDDGREVELDVNATHIRYRYTGEVSYTNLVALADLVGPAGAEQEFQVASNVLQTRTVGDPTWVDLLDFDTVVSPTTAGGGIKKVGDKVVLDRIDIKWDAGDETTKLGADIMMTDDVANTATTWTRSVQSVITPGYSLGHARRLRVSCPTGLTGGNTRIALPIEGSTSLNDRITSVWQSHTSGAQGGHFHRRNAHPTSATNFIVIAWHDVVFSVDSIINFNTWEANPAGGLTQGSSNSSGTIDFPGLQHHLDVRASFKNGATVTLHVDRGHGITVGGNVRVETAGIIDNIGTVTAVTATTITYTSSSTAAADVVGGPGVMMSRLSIFPLTFVSELVDSTLRVKAWPHERMEEPDWQTVTNALAWTNTGPTFPSSPGPSGIYVGHLATDVSYFEYGRVTWENLDA